MNNYLKKMLNFFFLKQNNIILINLKKNKLYILLKTKYY